jgi:hypothetical protein
MEETQEIQEALKERLASLRTKSQQTSSQYLAYQPTLLRRNSLINRELSHQKTKLLTQQKTLATGIRQFIKDKLADILYAEYQGALPGDPASLPRGKRRRADDDDDDEPEKKLAQRMITLVGVHFSFCPELRGLGIDESTCGAGWAISVGRCFGR